MKKPTLYAILAGRAQIDIANGDSINELRTLGTLSTIFDVYYNNEPYSDDKLRLGDPEIGPTRDYDYYYIRGNPELFAKVKGVRISFAYPYDEEVFAKSDAFIVLSENWKRHLLRQGEDSERKLEFIYGGVAPKIDVPVLNVGQKIDPRLTGASISDADLLEMRMRLTSTGNVFGYYGNLSRDLYPYRAFEAIERLGKTRGAVCDPVAALAGRFRKGSEISSGNMVYLGSLPYAKMPALHRSTLANLTNESPLNHCLGNQKVIDSISLGVPVVCQRLDTFVEQLGPYYPCYYETADEALRIFDMLINDEDFRDYARAASLRRAGLFRADQVERRFLEQDELSQFTS